MHRPRHFLLLLVLLSLGCATPVAIQRYAVHSYPARPADYPIALFDGECPDHYELLAKMTTRPYDDRDVDIIGKAELQSMARKLGGDAVVRLSRDAVMREEVGYSPGALLRVGTHFVDRYKLSGIVVRYSEHSAKP